MEVPAHIWKALDTAYAEIEAGNLETAEAGLKKVIESTPDVPEVHFLLGNLAMEQEAYQEAIDAYKIAVGLDDTYADAHHALGGAASEAGDSELALKHNLAVWALDSQADIDLPKDTMQEALRVIEGEAENLLAGLEAPYCDRLADVPVQIQERPSEEMVRAGEDPRALVVFTAATTSEPSGDVPAPPEHIILYWTNILDAADDDDGLTEELEITMLNELARFYDLDEDALEALGLFE